ncbi:sulfurtransferase FdhD [Rhodobacter sp. TJ_12]|uniref:formate dehydrogenase accessory sulfurtransferase FdhD n=1 Tax=Rhodobacter sp. TJ_12 TaxID=2029399 RepID=UPI001CBDDB7C|nr:formate dehydrogenase accessory sulfurtransferase FdhD [Rhodobacter sp. TJ_12]MBZ4021184.1 sulfurtransferase FdhD [Rhodobacter sp. TJ_12]
MSLPPGAVRVPLPMGGAAVLAEEVPLALVFDGVTQAVMMATPCDLEDFLIGFALTEGLIGTPGEILRHEVVRQDNGIELRGWLAGPAAARFKARRRVMAGPVGCGLCGIESLAEALRPLPQAPQGAGASAPQSLTAVADTALAALRAAQPLQDAVRAAHAVGFWANGALICAREDVGRHNALDKLAGGLARAGHNPGAGALVLTSRLSVDLVQKAAMIGARALIAPSAPTALAVAQAQSAGLALVARGPDGPTLFTPS